MFYLPRLHTVPPGRQQLQPAEVRVLTQKLHRRVSHQTDAVHMVFLSPEADHIQHIGGRFLPVEKQFQDQLQSCLVQGLHHILKLPFRLPHRSAAVGTLGRKIIAPGISPVIQLSVRFFSCKGASVHTLRYD